MTTLILATRNAHKVQEIRAILGSRFRYLTMDAFPEAPNVSEDQRTFTDNAVKKARELAKWLQRLPALDLRVPGTSASVLADDSGLEVDALGGAPGIHSARFAALDDPNASPLQNSPDATNNEKLLRLLKDVPREKRTARFRCVVSLIRVKPPERVLAGQLFEGVCEGSIQFAPSGQSGFGYDPLFIPHEYRRSFAELEEDVKNRISHRAQALLKMKDYLEKLVLWS